MTKYISVVPVTMSRLHDVKLMLLCTACLMAVAHGGVVVDECTSFQEKPPPLCCRYGDGNNDNDKEEEMERNMKLCLNEYMGDLSRTSRGEERISLMECVGECVFNYSKLLTPDLKLNKDVIMDMDDIVDEDPKWKAIDEAAINTCFDKIDAEISDSAKCKSGSYQLVRCMVRERFFNCPNDAWTESDECREYKMVVQRCTGLIPELYE
ncbi:uncharacterized protein [Halyomorpha halys]